MSDIKITVDEETYKVLQALASEKYLTLEDMAKSLFTEHSKALHRKVVREETVIVPAGHKALFVETAAYRHLEQIADALNADKWGGQDNTPQIVFKNLVFDRDLEDDPGEVMAGILDGLDYLPEKLYGHTKEDEKVMASRKAALTRRAAKIKWASYLA